jgi:hypothetical protein
MVMSRFVLSMVFVLALLGGLASTAAADTYFFGVTNRYNRAVRVAVPNANGVGDEIKEFIAPGHRWLQINRKFPPPGIRVIVEGGKGGDIGVKPHYDSVNRYWWYGVEIREDGSVIAN